MTSNVSPDFYKIPREAVDVEALAQQYCRYLCITNEDSEILSHDPTRRDKAVAELYEHPGIKANCNPEEIVPFGQSTDFYFKTANAELDRLTPPQTFEE